MRTTPTSSALSLRPSPYPLQGRVLIADSWFGSVACILALFERAIYAIMNVKTAHKGYPKDDLTETVGEGSGHGRRW